MSRLSRLRVFGWCSWQLGTAIATVDLYTREVDFDNLVFKMNNREIWVTWRGQVFGAPVPPPQNLVSFAEYLELEA